MEYKTSIKSDTSLTQMVQIGGDLAVGRTLSAKKVFEDGLCDKLPCDSKQKEMGLAVSHAGYPKEVLKKHSSEKLILLY